MVLDMTKDVYASKLWLQRNGVFWAFKFHTRLEVQQLIPLLKNWHHSDCVKIKLVRYVTGDLTYDQMIFWKLETTTQQTQM